MSCRPTAVQTSRFKMTQISKFFPIILLLVLPGPSSTQDANLTQPNSEKTYGFPPDFLKQMTLDSQSMTDFPMPAWLIALIPPLQGPICRFYVFTKKDGCKEGREVHIGNTAELVDSGFDKSKPVKFLWHGWTETWNMWSFYFPLSTKDAYCHDYDYNIVVMDYSRAVGYWTYAAFICRGLYDVVREGAEFIRWLITIGASFPEKTHLIGLSLGGQLVGLVGAELSKDPTTRVARVTGIDSAGPCFDPAHPLTYLCPCKSVGQINKEVATSVDCYHTNAGGLGMYSPCGHVDHWINGGEMQCIPESTFSHIISTVCWEWSIPPTGRNTRPACTEPDVRTLNQFRTDCTYKDTPFGENSIYADPGQYYTKLPCWELINTFGGDIQAGT